MERLTKYEIIGGYARVFPMVADAQKIISRLAAYEDTGLTPVEVSTLVKDWNDLCTIVGECGGISRVRVLAEADKNGRVVVLPRWKNEEERLERQRLMRIMADGAIDRLMKNPLIEESGPDIAELRVVNTDRLLELAKADEDGRSFLLPMEPGGRCSARSILSGRG